MNDFERTLALVTKRPSNIGGLKYHPTVEPHFSDDQDWPLFNYERPIEVSDGNLEVVESVVEEMGADLRNMMEIGIARNGARSMSKILMDKKPEGSTYVGIDLDDKSYLDDESRRIFTLKAHSHDQALIRNFLVSKGVRSLDLLFIDGWHSVNTCVNDWLYTDMLSPNGVVILHDTNAHPGCVTLFDAVDERLYRKVRYCKVDDYGIAVFRRKV